MRGGPFSIQIKHTYLLDKTNQVIHIIGNHIEKEYEMEKLKISFPMTGRYSNPVKKDDEIDIRDLADHFASRLVKEEDGSVEHQLRMIANDLIFEDRKGVMFPLRDIWYKPWQLDKTMFVAAHIISMDQYKKNFFHLLCEYEDSGKIYKGCFIVPEDRFLEAYENNANHCLIGTCVRKVQKISAYSYNKYSHSGSVASAEEKKITKMVNFYLL